MNKKEIIDFLKSKGYEQDRFGHFHIIEKGNQYRYKIQKTSIRYEIKVICKSGGSPWIRIWSQYYKNLQINPETNKLKVIKTN